MNLPHGFQKSPSQKPGLLVTVYRAFEALARLADRTEPRPLPESYRDTSQFGVACEETFLPSAFGSESFFVSLTPKDGAKETVAVGPGDLAAFVTGKIAEGAQVHRIEPGHVTRPTVSGRSRVYQPFKPHGLHVSEIVEATYGKSGMPDVTLYEVVPQTVSDLVLVCAFVGNKNAFPTAPDQSTGVNCALFSVPGNKLSWPTISGGIDISLTFAIEKSILGRARAGLPPGYDPTPKRITVRVRAGLIGDQLR